MTRKINHTTPQGIRKKSSFIKGLIVLCLAGFFLQPVGVFAQVISNYGAAISVTSGAVVESKDLNNFSDSIGNEGSINLSGDYYNALAAQQYGNGLYTIMGNWTNLGLFSYDTSTVTFIGSGNHLITHGSNGETFYNLALYKTGSITHDPVLSSSTLDVINKLNIFAGTLDLGSNTSNLNVGDNALIQSPGILLYNGSLAQTGSITGNLRGSGTIDMSQGLHAHLLNLYGDINELGTLKTLTGISKVDYVGANQTAFPSPNYRFLSVSTPGTKTLMGNSIVGLDLNIDAGVFDLGPIANTFEVKGLTDITGGFRFNGGVTQTAYLRGDMSGSGLLDMSGGNRPHLLNLEGVNNSISSFTSGSGTVDYVLDGVQNIFTSQNYWNLRISGNGNKLLNNDISAAGVLTMLAGNIDTQGDTLKITSPDIGAIVRNDGTVIGMLRRAIGITGSNYLYPVGSDTSYNPMKIRFHQLTPGNLTAQFKLGDIGNITTPLEDLDGNEIWDRFTQAYWRLNASSSLASTKYDVSLNYDGFEVVDSSSRIIKRTDGGIIELDGKGGDGSINGTEIRRDSLENGISTFTTDLGIGKGRPKIKDQPIDTSVCEGSAAFFEVRSTRLGKVKYQWYIFHNSTWKPLEDTSIYSGTKTRRLELSTTDTLLTGNLYLVILADKWGNINISNTVKLTVNKIPKATATPPTQIVCNNEPITPVVLRTSNYVTGTTFRYQYTKPAGIISSIPLTGGGMTIGQSISGSFENTTLDSIMIEFTVIPTGPLTTSCEGDPITFTVTVNPTPRILVSLALAEDTVICNTETPGIIISNPNTKISGTWNYNLTVIPDVAVAGAVGNTTNDNTLSFANTLTNSDTLLREVSYLFKPNIFNADGTPVNSCSSINDTIVIKVAPTLLSTASPFAYIGGYNIRCYNEDNGSIDISPRGGYYPVPYIFNWTKGPAPVSAIEDPAGLTVGTYKYSITDKIGCYFEQNVTLTQPDTLYAIATRIDSVSCMGAFNGAVFVDVFGGSPVPVYNFKWVSPDGITTNDTLLKARFGYHDLTVKDANNCSFDDRYRVSIADEMTVTPVIPRFGDFEISCFGDSTGTIIVYADGNGDKADYRYYWTNVDDNSPDPQIFPETADTLNDLPAGTYELTVVDSWGCEGYGYYPLYAPQPIKVKRTNPLYPGDFDISCPDLSDGVISDSVYGGHTAYTSLDFNWTMDEDPLFNANTRDIANLRAGKYKFNITDLVFGCIGDTAFTLKQPDEMVLDNVQISDYNTFGVSCKSSSDGIIEPLITGGFGAKEYSWFRNTELVSFSNNKDQSGLKADDYHLYVRDMITDCPAEFPFVITEPDTVSLDLVPLSYNGFEISCFGGDSGSISLNTIGGVSPYSFSWSSENIAGFNASTQNLDSLKAGIYTVVVTDQNNCVVNRTDTLYQPEKLATSIVPATISCFSTNNGAADLTISGGIENTYQYRWSDGSSTQDLDSLFMGRYFVDITDANNCTISDTTFVTEPPEIIISMDVPLPQEYNGRMISCFGESDASISSIVSGGVGLNRVDGNYIYTWRHKQSTWSQTGINDNIISDVPAGEYILTITDGNVCLVSDSIIVEQPFKLNAQVYETNPTCNGKTDGQLTLIVQGGTPEYFIDWYTIGKHGQTADSIGIGRYDVMITDLNNCRDSTFGLLRQPDPITFESTSNNPKCPDTPDGELSYLNIKGGTEPYELELFNLDIPKDSTNLGLGSEKKVTDLFEGRYLIKITDNNQCILSDTSNLVGRSIVCIETPNAFSPNGDGINDTWIIDDIELYPEVTVEVYNRWGEMVYYAPNGYTEPWDGTYKGRELPIDSYYYVFDLNPRGDKKYKGRTEITGDITIIR